MSDVLFSDLVFFIVTFLSENNRKSCSVVISLYMYVFLVLNVFLMLVMTFMCRISFRTFFIVHHI